MTSAPKPSEMFSDAHSDAERAERFEGYKDSLNDAYKSATSGGLRYVHGEGFHKVGVSSANAERVEKLRELSKSLTGDAGAEIQATLNQMQADLVKEIDSGGAGSVGTPTLGGSTTLGQTQGFVPVDLEAPSKKLVPRQTPLRNAMPRNNGGKGTGVSFRRVRGWSNSNSGTVGDMSSFFSSEQENTSYSGITAIRRPNQISYATDVNTIAYVEQGLGSSVSWRTQYAGQGYEDIRQLASTALLWSTMQAEEKNLLMGRGATALGYAGALNGGVGPAGSLFTATPSTTGGSLAAGTTYAFYFTYSTGNGETAVGAGLTGVTTTGSTSSIKLTVTSAATAFAAGAQGINVYFNSTATSATAQYVGTLVPNTASTLTVTVLPTGAANPAATDQSSNPFGYDGLLSILTNTAGAGNGQGTGYFSQFTGSGTTGVSGVGDAPFQTAFEVLYGASTMPNSGNGYTGTYVQAQGAAFGAKLLADPDVIYLDGTIRSALGQFLKANASGSAYRIMLTEGGVNGEKVGAVVNGIYNQVTGKPVDLVVEPYMPPGSAIIYSKTLPVPDSEVSNTFEVRNVQDYMMYEWAPVGMTWDASTYMFGTLVPYAPAWSGAITGLLP